MISDVHISGNDSPMVKTTVDAATLRSLLVLGSVVEARDPFTGGHLWRVARIARLLGDKAGLESDDLFRLSLSAFLHDLGKVGIPDSVLLKQGPLDDEEVKVMRTHPRIGRDLLVQHPLGDLVVDVVAHHHEWVDGRGYPEGLRDRDLSFFSRIVALADVFDALTSRRPYRENLSVDDAFGILREGAGTHFDPAVLNHLETLRDRGRLDEIVGHSDMGQRLVVCHQCGPVIVAPQDASDGDVVVCRPCHGEFRLHRTGDSFEAEFTGDYADPVALRPQPEMPAVESILRDAPLGRTL